MFNTDNVFNCTSSFYTYSDVVSIKNYNGVVSLGFRYCPTTTKLRTFSIVGFIYVRCCIWFLSCEALKCEMTGERVETTNKLVEMSKNGS